MREILFRGKKVHSDKWLYGVPVKGTEKDANEMIMIASVFDQEGYCCRGCNLDPVIPETIGQFTGLTDKNGKKIFEGDIVRGTITSSWKKASICCEIIYKNDCFLAVEKSPKGNEWGHKVRFARDIEVIGNIHDNPELIEVKA